jgi:hypothetical protein
MNLSKLVGLPYRSWEVASLKEIIYLHGAIVQHQLDGAGQMVARLRELADYLEAEFEPIGAEDEAIDLLRMALLDSNGGTDGSRF